MGPSQNMADTPNKDTVDTPSQNMADTPSQNIVDIPSQNTPNQNTPSQNMVDTPSQNTVHTPGQNMADTVIMVINQSQLTNHTATVTDHRTEVTQDRRMDNLWVTMAHPPMVHPVLPKVTMAHVIPKAIMALPLNKDRRNLKIKLVQNNFI